MYIQLVGKYGKAMSRMADWVAKLSFDSSESAAGEWIPT